MQLKEIAFRGFQFHFCIPEFLKRFSQMYHMLTFHLAVYYNVIYIENKEIIKIIKEELKHNIQEDAWP